MLAAPLIIVIAIIGIALFFDFTNGFHDSANSISTVVSTKVLSPRNAVAFAAFFNFIAAFGFGVAVASTISKIVELNYVQTEVIPYIVLGALIGAISWNLITWFSGLPTSSSHALIGGLTGAGISAAGLCRNQMVNGRRGRPFHDPFTDYWVGMRVPVHGSDPQSHKKSQQAHSRELFQAASALFCGSIQFQPWDQ